VGSGAYDLREGLCVLPCSARLIGAREVIRVPENVGEGRGKLVVTRLYAGAVLKVV